MKVMLIKKASGNSFSLESGLADGQNHFDHHGVHHENPAPCNDDRIPTLDENDMVEITHIDADTYIGLLRMAGKELPDVDVDLMEKIDLNGSSACSNKFDLTLLYMVGVNQLARDLKFPFPKDEPQEVTHLIETMMEHTENKIIKIGRKANMASLQAYIDCNVASNGTVGYWVIGPNDPLDPSRAYEDGIDVVIVHRKHYKSISIYCNPLSEYAFGGKTVASIEFAGHPKAAGSPRGIEFNTEDGRRVYDALV